jgi:tetratricopeptide (TPR) repeat protein
MRNCARHSRPGLSARLCGLAIAAVFLAVLPSLEQTSPSVSAAAASQQAVKSQAPTYPLMANAGAGEGIVVMAFSAEKDGRIHDLSLLSGPPLLAWRAFRSLESRRSFLAGRVSRRTDGVLELTFTPLSPHQQPAQVSPRVSVAAANQHLVKKVAPVYPMGARVEGIQGIVVLDVSIGKDGKIDEGDFLSGPLQLAWAAIRTVKQWRFRPFLVDGTPQKVKALVGTTFVLGQPGTEVKNELHDAMAYSESLVQCRSLLAARTYDQAAKICGSLPAFAAKLPSANGAERVDAEHFAGVAAFDRGDYEASIAFFRREISAAKASLKAASKRKVAFGGSGASRGLWPAPDAVRDPAKFELGCAYGELAVALADDGKLNEAVPEYKHAISVFEDQSGLNRPKETGDPFTSSLEPLLRQYASVLRKLGRTGKAKKVTRKADKLARRIHR